MYLVVRYRIAMDALIRAMRIWTCAIQIYETMKLVTWATILRQKYDGGRSWGNRQTL